jgi:CubicO group peptidase (beta-lactamase class C family)
MCVLISTLVTSSHGQLKNSEVVKKSESFATKTLLKDSDWTGTWKGLIAGQLEIIFHLQGPVKAGDKWTGNFDVPMQMVKGFVLDHIEIKGDEIKFELVGVPGNAKYEGRMTESLQMIDGRFRQFVINQPMKLAKDTAKPVVFDSRQINALAEKLLKDWNAPGLAIGIVKGGKLIHAAGYGYKDVEKKEKMSADTLLAIGSCTKAFTTATIAKLVEEGKLDWDRPVNHYWPGFRIADPFTTQIITLRDMVTHRTGLPRHDLIWFTGELSRAEILSRVPHLAASASLRQKWIYNNIMYTTAGAVAELAGGKPWEQQVREAFLNPLEMKRTNFHINELKADPDHATGYHKPGVAKETWLVKPYREIAGMAPAGSINSSVKEMSAWMNFQLGHGPKNSEGNPLLKETSIRELQSPQMIIVGGLTPAERNDVHSMGYAMGWSVESYRGHRHVQHGGAIDGFVAQVDLFPDDDFGIVALVNQSGSALPGVICPTIADMLLELDPVDWSGQVLAKVEAVKKVEASTKTEMGKSRVAGTKPSHELKDYVGVFQNAAYSRVEIKLEGDHLSLQYGNVKFDLGHWHYDVFNPIKTKPEDDAFEDKKFQFHMDPKGLIYSVSADMEPMVPPVVFNRIAEERLRDPKFLASFTGEYELANQVMKIELEGNTLKAVLPGQPVYKLVPERGLTFLFDGLNGFKMEFEMDANGKPIGVSIEQPNGTFKAKKKLK